MMDQKERLKTIITQMILSRKFWGYLFARVRREESNDISSIMGVFPQKDGTISLKFSPRLMENTDDKTIKLLLEHEGMHILNKHIPRLLRMLSNELNKDLIEDRIKVWNTAADCAVNDLIAIPDEVVIGNELHKVCKSSLYNLKEKQSTEFYFESLWYNLEDQKKGSGKFEYYGEGEDYDSIDVHDGWGEISSEISDISSLSRKTDTFSRQIIRSSFNLANKDRGSIDSLLKELILEAIAPPKAPYFQIIRNYVVGTKVSKFKRHFSKINRKRTYVFAIGDEKNVPQISPFPGRTRDFTFNIGVVLDTSGSQSADDIKEGLSGCKNIIENDRHCTVTVLEVDTKVRKEYEIKRISDIDMNVKGRGGTTLYPGLERCKELNVDVALVFTDGYCDNINDYPRATLPKKIIWVIGENGNVENINRTGCIVRI